MNLNNPTNDLYHVAYVCERRLVVCSLDYWIGSGVVDSDRYPRFGLCRSRGSTALDRRFRNTAARKKIAEAWHVLSRRKANRHEIFRSWFQIWYGSKLF